MHAMDDTWAQNENILTKLQRQRKNVEPRGP